MYFKTLPNIVYPFKESATSKSAKTKVVNPFTKEGDIEYLKVLTRNQRKGETVVSARSVTKIDEL